MAIDCAGALVEPGDVIVGDGDGVVVVPPDLVAAVVTAAIVQEREERYILEQVEQGESVDGLYPMNTDVARPLRRQHGRRAAHHPSTKAPG